MSDALKIIKDELARIDEARAKATPLYYTKHQKMKHFTDYLIGVDCCQEEPFVIADMNRNMDNWKHDLEFIALAANEITKLTKALSVAVESLQYHKDGCPQNDELYDWIQTAPISNNADETLKTIANILTNERESGKPVSGGKDGK